MLTHHQISEAFGMLRTAGVKGGPTPANDHEATILVEIWRGVLGHLTPAEFHRGLQAFLADPAVCQWWPQPGIILGHAPRRPVPRLLQARDPLDPPDALVRDVAAMRFEGAQDMKIQVLRAFSKHDYNPKEQQP